MVDPNYWKQQYFLAGRLKTLLPNRDLLCCLELAPTDAKHIGYLCPDKESGSKLERYIVLGDVDKDLVETLQKQGEVFKVGVEFENWDAGKKAAGLGKELVDVALLTPGTAVRLGITNVGLGLTEIRKALKFDGRVLILVSDKDEVALGGKLEEAMEVQDSRDLEELEAIGLAGGEGPAGQVFRSAGLRLIRVLRDECGLAVAICVKREEEKPRVARRQRGPAAAARRGLGGPRPRPGRPVARRGVRAVPEAQPPTR